MESLIELECNTRNKNISFILRPWIGGNNEYEVRSLQEIGSSTPKENFLCDTFLGLTALLSRSAYGSI